MKTLTSVLLLVFALSAFCNEVDFFREQVEKEKEGQGQYKYEDIIGGGVAFVLGNVGFFTTHNTPLRLSYSLVQTIGIINVSDGVLNLNHISQDKYYYYMFKKYPRYQDPKKNIQYFSRNLIAIAAKNDKAIRLSRLYRSSLLTAQYLINTLDSRTSGDLKNIYYFMAGINLIAASYSYFTRSEYELYYEKVHKVSFFAPFAMPQGAGLAYSQQF